VQHHADDAAALGAGDGLHEKEAVDLQPQGVGAQVRALQQANGVVELHRLARQQHELGDQRHMREGEHRGRGHEETAELDAGAKQRQGDAVIEEKIAVGEGADAQRQVGHQGQEQQPQRIGACRRRVEKIAQAVRIDGRPPVERSISGVHCPVSRKRRRFTSMGGWRMAIGE
jgi:hypothetical protein